MGKINTGHFLMGCGAPTMLRLLRDNAGTIAPDKRAQTALMAATSVALAPAAALEKAVFARRIRASRPERDPIFVLGHWRSGTTYLQNMLSRDPQFGWFDPVSTVVFPYRLLLGRALTPAVKKGIAGGRPMDNVQYSLDLPMEETFALLTQTPHDIIHMMAFPARFQDYLSGAFVADLPEKERREWMRRYDYIIRKQTYVQGGRQLILKSPDNTCRVPELRELYPEARFINIHRDPYRTIRSFVHMFSTQVDILHLSVIPENFDVLLEDTIVELFRRMYSELFAQIPSLPENRFADVAYTDFCREPVETLRRIYDRLELGGFAAAESRFRAFAAEQKDYRKNRLELSPRLIRKINDRLGFYFDYYGYDRMEAGE